MATENINIIIREDGSRQVVQNLNQLANSGDKANASMDALARALEVLAAALAIDKLKDYADEWASITGIVEVATKTHQEATAVLHDLFDAAQAVRSPIDEMAQLYGRAARAATDLGASQEQAIQFTKEVGQALVVQHTTATQASGALLQLGQLLGTGKVRAQEFNSVNENLSVVLQVVARNVDGAGGSVNRLKALVENGTVGSKQFFDAFLKGSAGLQADFDKSAFTIGQGLTLIGNSFVKMVGDLNNATGASNTFGQAAKALADHMQEVESVIVGIAKVLAAATAGWVAYTAATATASAVSRVSAFLAEVDAIAKGTFVVLGSAEAERQKAVAAQAGALADSQAAIAARNRAVAEAEKAVAITEAATADAVARNAIANAMRDAAAAELAEAAAAETAATRHLQAAQSAGALSFALAEAKIATIELAAAEGARDAALTSLIERNTVEVATEEAVTAALVQQASAQARLAEVTVAADAAMIAANNTLIASQGKVVATSLAAAGTTSRLSQVFGLLRGAIAPVLGFLGELFVLINANPITALITALVVATGLLLGFGDHINAGIDSITTLGDVTAVLKDRVSSSFRSLGAELDTWWGHFTEGGTTALGQVATAASVAAQGYAGSFQQAFATTQTGFTRWVVIIARILDELFGILRGLGQSLVSGFTFVWQTIEDLGKAALEVLLGTVEGIINTIIDKVNELLHTSFSHIDIPKPNVDPAEFQDLGQKTSDAFSDGFLKGIHDEGGAIENAVVGVLDDAAARAAGTREAEKFARAAANNIDLTTHGKAAKPPIDPKEITAARNALAQLLEKIDPASAATLELAKAEDVLNRALKDGIITHAQRNKYLQEAIQYYEELADPFAKTLQQIQQETNLLGLSVQAREVEAQVEQIINEKKQQNIKVGQAEVDQLRESITAHNDRARIVAEEDALISATVLSRQKYVNQLAALQELLNRPTTLGAGFTSGDRAQKLLEIDPEVLSTTSVAIDAVKAQYDGLYDHINTLRAKNVIDDDTATRLLEENANRLQQQINAAAVKAAQARLDLGSGDFVDAQLVMLSRLTQGFTTFTSGASQAFGDFFSSFEQGFADSVGKAVVESKNLGEALHNVAQQAVEGLISALVKLGIQWLANYAIQELGISTTTATSTAAAEAAATAWATPAALAAIATEGGAAAAGTAAVLASLAVVQGAALFQDGGYTGNGSVGAPAGIVHGKEFVVNAAGTAKNRDLLEMMNNGVDVSNRVSSAARSAAGNSSDVALNVEVHNYGNSQISVERLSAKDVRIIAKEVVQSEAPRAVASDLSDPNSRTSRAMSRHTTAQRNRKMG